MMSIFLTWKFLAPRKLKLWHHQHTAQDDRPVGCGANLAERIERIDGTEKHRMIFARLERRGFTHPHLSSCHGYQHQFVWKNCGETNDGGIGWY